MNFQIGVRKYPGKRGKSDLWRELPLNNLMEKQIRNIQNYGNSLHVLGLSVYDFAKWSRQVAAKLTPVSLHLGKDVMLMPYQKRTTFPNNLDRHRFVKDRQSVCLMTVSAKLLSGKRQI